MTYIVGIDPGENGAIAIIPAFSFKSTIAMGMDKNELSDILLYLSELRGGAVWQRTKAVLPIKKDLNYIHSRLPVLPREDESDNGMEVYLEEPGQIVVNRLTTTGASGKKDSTGALLAGMTASRKLGRSIGRWEGICTALHILPTLVAPKKWQARLGCPTRGDKRISLNLAKKVFWFLTNAKGESTITHSTADALLIALYGYLQTANPKYIPKSVADNIPI